MNCVDCGKAATIGSLSHPYCVDCWDRLWKGKEKQFFEWIPYHNTVLGMLWYKENILEQRLNLCDRFLLLFVGKGYQYEK